MNFNVGSAVTATAIAPSDTVVIDASMGLAVIELASLSSISDWPVPRRLGVRTAKICYGVCCDARGKGYTTEALAVDRIFV